MTESSIENAFVRWCNKNHIHCFKLVALSRRGFPDRTVIMKDRIIFLEFKQPGGKRRVHQIEFQKLLRKLGFVCEFVDSVDAAKEVIGRFR